MGLLATVALVVLGISFMTFVTFFGRLPALRKTPIAWLHRLIWVHIPNGVLAVDQRFTSGKITTSLSRFGNYMMYDKHPTVLIFFILLLSVGETLFLPTAWPQMSAFQKSTGGIAIILPYIFLYLSAFTDPGFISPQNHTAEMARYPYDFSLFHPGTECSTCRLLKPARSKHCSVCKRCIAKCDHHCIFINNCVGARNQRWFILLLLSTAVLTLYGGILGINLMSSKILLRFPHWSLLPWRANQGSGMPVKEYLILWSWGMQNGVAMGAVTLLALLTSPLVWGLLGYHLWLIYCGTTTNESLKWSDWQAEMDDGFAFKRTMQGDRQKRLGIEPAWTRWPVETEQILVRTEDGRAPAAQGTSVPGVGEWEPVWRLKDVENLYDLGFWDNLVDVFVPGYMYRDPLTPVVEDVRARRRKGRKKKARGL
ncbi:DHHC palmitoyltransferase-domain-containing protein [Apodospora peruviana]|uniref:Palmitoyltransferase n=1 Tax=Apodospora peruviana TaxID=516989 RepID=A0AAE0I012_9PEZI|nr:DHHC palmitoyltransferase-domain-containing protein [Apodospora peruviana]